MQVQTLQASYQEQITLKATRNVQDDIMISVKIATCH